MWDLFLICRQALILGSGAAGYGCWLWQISGRPPPLRRNAWLWLGFAGFALHALILQELVYCGLPLRVTAWPAFGLALAGLGFTIWRQPGRSWRLPDKFRRESRLYAAVFALGFVGQLPALVAVTPERFYGAGHYDQANYIVTAEYLAEWPMMTGPDEVGYRPWLLRAVEAGRQRITQCVILGAVAVVSGSDSHDAYGVVSIFFLAIAGLATTAWLRANALPRWACASAGVAVALSPAMTWIHLDGFFSQNASLFVYPALGGILTTKGPVRIEMKWVAATLLAYLVGTYSEVSIWGVAIVVALLLLAREPFATRWRNIGMVLGGALLLDAGYLGYLFGFVSSQWQMKGTNAQLGGLVPESGTLAGWGRMFIDQPAPDFAVKLAGLLVASAVGWSCWYSFRHRRHSLAVMIGLVVLPLLYLRLRSDFPAYPFAKLCAQFVPLWVGLCAIALALLAKSRPRMLPVILGVAIAAPICVYLTSLPRQWRVIQATDRLAVLSSLDLLERRREAEAHPERVYLVSCSDPLLAQWLCYFGRHSDVVVNRRTLGDRIVTTEANACRRWNGSRDELWWLDPKLTGRVIGYEPPPGLFVHDALEINRTPSGSYYAIGQSARIDFTNASSASLREIWLDCVVVPWPSRKTAMIELVNPEGRKFPTEVKNPGWRRWSVVLHPGRNSYRLNVISPEGDARTDEPNAILRLVSVEVSPEFPVADTVTAPFAVVPPGK
jgi:hypothetical protein